jgi:hypothetical protein
MAALQEVTLCKGWNMTHPCDFKLDCVDCNLLEKKSCNNTIYYNFAENGDLFKITLNSSNATTLVSIFHGGAVKDKIDWRLSCHVS